MADPTLDPSAEAADALRTAVQDYGPRALSNPKVLTNLFKDLLPTLPREASLLVQASEAGVPDLLAGHIAQQIPPDAAVQLTAATLSERRALDPAACSWATAQMAAALGYPVALLPSTPVNPVDPATGAPPGGPPLSPPAPVVSPPTSPPVSSPPAAMGDAHPPTVGTPPPPLAASPPPPAGGWGSPPPEPGGWPTPTPTPGTGGPPPPGGAAPAGGWGSPPAPTPPPWQGPGAAATVDANQPAAPGSWGPGPPAAQPPQYGAQPPQYGPPPQYGAPPPPSGRSRTPWFVGGAVALVVIIVIVAVALSGGSSPTKPPATTVALPTTLPVLPTEPPVPTTTQPPSTTTQPLFGGTPTGFVDVTQLLPDDVSAGSDCQAIAQSNLPAGLVGETTALSCQDAGDASNSDPGIPGGQIMGMQFDNSADFISSLQAFNNDEGFNPTASDTGQDCPPASGYDGGEVGWHNDNYQGELECYSNSSGGPVYIWTIPAQNAIIAAVGGDHETATQLDSWWTSFAGPHS